MIPELDHSAAAPAAPIVPGSIRQAAAADLVTVDRSSDDRSIAAPAVPPIDYTAEGRELVEFTVGMLSEPYPSLATVYTADVRSRMGVRVGALLKKYELTGADLWGRFEPEIMLAITVVPLIGPTVRAIRADRATAEATPARPVAPAAVDLPAPAGRPDDQPAPVAPGALAARFPGLEPDGPPKGAAIARP